MRGEYAEMDMFSRVKKNTENIVHWGNPECAGEGGTPASLGGSVMAL